MMDITKRLRQNERGLPGDLGDLWTLCHEAADEIDKQWLDGFASGLIFAAAKPEQREIIERIKTEYLQKVGSTGGD